MSLPLWSFGPMPVTAAELSMLRDAAATPDMSVSDVTHRTRRRTARALAVKGLLFYQAGADTGWEPGMWMATLTCPGCNALWRAEGDRHMPGCGSPWGADGVCTGCGALRRLDAAAFDTFLEACDREEASFLTGRTRLWCDEHGFARERDWTTDKTCRRSGGSPYHERNFARV